MSAVSVTVSDKRIENRQRLVQTTTDTCAREKKLTYSPWCPSSCAWRVTGSSGRAEWVSAAPSSRSVGKEREQRHVTRRAANTRHFSAAHTRVTPQAAGRAHTPFLHAHLGVGCLHPIGPRTCMFKLITLIISSL